MPGLSLYRFYAMIELTRKGIFYVGIFWFMATSKRSPHDEAEKVRLALSRRTTAPRDYIRHIYLVNLSFVGPNHARFLC